MLKCFIYVFGLFVCEQSVFVAEAARHNRIRLADQAALLAQTFAAKNARTAGRTDLSKAEASWERQENIAWYKLQLVALHGQGPKKCQQRSASSPFAIDIHLKVLAASGPWNSLTVNDLCC